MGIEDLTPTQQKIHTAISSLSTQGRPFVTIDDITNCEWVEASRQTVLNNIDAVVEEDDFIRSTTVGQANVYYIKQDRMDEIWNEKTEAITAIEGPSRAAYAELRNTPEDSEFDFKVHWYAADTTELDAYNPGPSEIGQATGGYASEPVKIKFWDPEEAFETEPIEEDTT